MSDPIVILEESGSAFAPRLAGALAASGSDCVVRSLDAAFEGRPVTLSDGRVTWEGVELLEAGAIFLERPVFPWPQPASLGTLAVAREDRPRVAERQARSLTISALLTAASTRRVVNRPESGALSASRGAALAALQTAKIPVHPHSVLPARPAAQDAGSLIMDLIGRERWHRSSSPPAGDHCLRIEPVAGDVFGLLLVGGEPAGARRHASGAAWADGRGGEPCAPGRVPATLAEAAARAAAALEIDIAEVWLTRTPAGPEVLLVEPGPDLSEWDADLDGRLATQVARLLGRIAVSARGEER